MVDISAHLETKIAAIKAYSSQFFDPNSKEPSTPISSQNFIDSVRYRAQNLGRLSNVDAAECFTTERSPLINDFKNIR